MEQYNIKNENRIIVKIRIIFSFRKFLKVKVNSQKTVFDCGF